MSSQKGTTLRQRSRRDPEVGLAGSGGQVLDENSNCNGTSPPSFRTTTSVPRLVQRNLPFNQSRNRVQVEHNLGFKIFMLLRHDWFHVLVRIKTWQSLGALLSIWTVMIIIFAGLYMLVDTADPNINCGLGPVGYPIRFGPAFAFSLETCTTVGYGLPNGTNAYFENCPSLQVVIYFQMVWSMMFNAFLFAFFYSRLARCDARGAQVVLSNKAIVTVVDGQVRFQVRVYDVDASSPVVEAHIRMYALTKNRPVPRPLRILQPDDDLGGMLFLSVPSVVSHHIDLYSMLHPPRETPVSPAGIVLRQADSTNGSRDDIVCSVCGESYGTYERWSKHVKYQRLVEEKDDYPVAGTHLSLDKSDFAADKYEPTLDIDALRDYFQQELSEVICVVEGIEPIGSGTFSSMQSYRFDDIVFHAGAQFYPCIEAVDDDNDSYIRVDLERFHGIEINAAKAAAALASRRDRKPQRSGRPQDSFFAGGGDEKPRKAVIINKDETKSQFSMQEPVREEENEETE